MPKLGGVSSTKERINGLKEGRRKSLGGWRKGGGEECGDVGDWVFTLSPTLSLEGEGVSRPSP
jgi:hypothetical protein